MTEPIDCSVTGCPKQFTDKRGVDSHFAFTDDPPHPLSERQTTKQKIDATDGSGASSNGYPDDWEKIRQRILTRDEYRCQRCGDEGGLNGTAELHVHHQTPLSEGGSHEPENLVTLCQSCHSDEHGWPVGTNRTQQSHWTQRDGDDLLVRCGRCNHEAILQRNPGQNQIICENCGGYNLPANDPNNPL